jgi:transcription initiation factor TFIID TATA-box-binding protein
MAGKGGGKVKGDIPTEIKTKGMGDINPIIKVQNIVVSGDLHATIDLYTLSKKVKAVDYEPEQFPGAIFRIEDPKAVIILFKNGKMICTGTNTEANIRKILKYAADMISKYVIEVNPVEKKPSGAEKKGK